jgi:hypothetical protein
VINRLTEWIKMFRWIGRFEVRGNDDVLDRADKKLDEIERKQQELLARQRLLDIQATPRGKLYG